MSIGFQAVALWAAISLGQAPDAGTPVVKPPSILREKAAVFPEEALQNQLSGDVVLELDLSETGAVLDARVLQPAGHGFDEAAVEAVKGFEFSPAEVDGQPTAVRIQYTYRFVWQKPPETEKKPILTATLAGRVLQRATRKPLLGAEVTVPALAKSTLADSEGRFALEGLPEGKYRVVVVLSGHDRFETDETLVAGKAANVTYYVRRTYASAFETTVRAKRERKEVTLTTLEDAEVQRIPGSQGDSLKVVQNLPGVARPALNGGAIAIRGTSPQQSGIYLDGIRIPLLFHFIGLTSVYNSDLLASVDYLPGNFPTYYGNALGGVVDVKSRSGRSDRLGGTASVSLLEAAATLEGPLAKNLTFAVAGRRSYVDALLGLAPSGAFSQGLTVAPRYYDGQLKLEWKPHPKHTVSFLSLTSEDVSENTIDRPTGADPAFAGDFLLKNGFTQYRLRYQYQGDRYRADTQAMLGTGISFLQLGSALGLDIRFRDQTLRHTSEYDLSDSLSLSGGIDVVNGLASVSINTRGQQPREGQPNLPAATQERVTTTANDNFQYFPSTFADLKWKPLQNLLLVGGVRSESYIYTEQERPRRVFSPRFAFRYDLVPEWTLKGGTGLYHSFPVNGDPGATFGNPELLGNRSQQSSVGFEWKPTQEWFVSLEGFYNRLDNLVVRSSNTVERNGETVNENLNNDGIGRIYGAEVFIRRALTERFFGWVAYTLSKSERLDRPGEQWRRFDNDQTHILTMIASYKLPYGWQVGARWRLASGNPYTPVIGAVRFDNTDTFVGLNGLINSARLPSFNQLDIRIDKTFEYETWSLEVFLDLLNANNNPAIEGVTYNYNFTQTGFFTGLPLLPILGMKGRF